MRPAISRGRDFTFGKYRVEGTRYGRHELSHERRYVSKARWFPPRLDGCTRSFRHDAAGGAAARVYAASCSISVGGWRTVFIALSVIALIYWCRSAEISG